MAKIPMIADVHLGVPGRLHDIVWSLNVVEAYCARENLDLIFGLGDLFNDRRALEIDALCAGYDYFSKARQQHDQRWIWLPGNHDMFLKHSWEINSLRPLSEVITIIETVKIIKVAGIRFWVLPFIHFESAYMRVLKKIEEQHEDGQSQQNYLCAVYMSTQKGKNAQRGYRQLLAERIRSDRCNDKYQHRRASQ